ncbi:Protein fam45a [Homalodisca vitripennis]|nr:Protein fam45a [Homalodisca vitripennis]
MKWNDLLRHRFSNKFTDLRYSRRNVILVPMLIENSFQALTFPSNFNESNVNETPNKGWNNSSTSLFISHFITEKDCNNDILWAWTYPSIRDVQKTLILRKCSFDLAHPFLYGRYRNEWFYISCTEVFESDCLRGVKQFALVVWSRDFNPEKYETLCRILSKTYCKTGNPAMLLKLFLSVITRGACTTEENGTYFTKDFERSSIQNNATMIRDLIKLFGLQTIVIYTALLLKKRLVVYHHSLPHLLKWVHTFPALMAHRPEAELLHPWLDLCPDEVDQLVSSQSYIVGCSDSRILSRVDLFDVLVNLPAQEITIAPHAKGNTATSAVCGSAITNVSIKSGQPYECPGAAHH